MPRVLPPDAPSAHQRAARRLTTFGLLFTLYGLFLLNFSPRRSPNLPLWIRSFFLALSLSLSLLPGLGYLALAPFVRRQRHFAVIASLSLAILHAAFNGTVAIALLMRERLLIPILCLACTLFAVLLCHPLLLAYLSARSTHRQGFQPILRAVPIPPPTPDQS